MNLRSYIVQLALVVMALTLGIPRLAWSADSFEPIREFIRAGLTEQSVPSIAVAVARDGRIIWEEGFGWANREQRILADEHTMYSLASISKPVTATGLMVLVQAGKIDLDQAANDYLGNAKLRARVGDAREATVRRVANHTSGLPLHYQFFYADEPYAVPSMDETILRYGNLVTAPGERFEYSNLGYGVLDYIIERSSGTSYAEFMRREVFLPLGLLRTSVDIGPGLERYAAVRYGSDGLPIPFYDFDHPGASAVFSSAHDLARFALFHLKTHLRDQKAILSDATLDAMHRGAAPPAAGYGIGFAISERYGYHYISHSGSMGGVATNMALFPREKLAVVVLSNSASRLPSAVTQRILATQLPKWKVVERSEPPAPPAFTAKPELIGAWQGIISTYAKDEAVQMRFLPDGNVHIRIADQPETLVNRPQLEEGTFTGEVGARILTPDAERYAHTIALSLTLRRDVLNGSATAADIEGPRVRNALTYWIELKKQ